MGGRTRAAFAVGTVIAFGCAASAAFAKDLAVPARFPTIARAMRAAKLPQSGMYHLRFQGGSNDARVLTVFKERFEDAVAQNALSSELVRDIDDALGSN